MTEELTLYERSKNNIWTDKWISKNMLSAHLDLDNDAASRNIRVINKTVGWIAEALNPNSRILDLGCGPGLYAERLAERGYAVTGLDISKRSIQYAKKSAKKQNLNIRYIHQNYLKKEISGTFDCALCIYCDFGALIPEEQQIWLKNVGNALDKDGILIFDVFTEGLSNVKKEGKRWNYYADGCFWTKKPGFVLEETVHFPRHNAWGSRSLVIRNRVKEYITWDTYYTKERITELLGKNGFAVESVTENLVEKNAFTSDAVLFVKARKNT